MRTIRAFLVVLLLLPWIALGAPAAAIPLPRTPGAAVDGPIWGMMGGWSGVSLSDLRDRGVRVVNISLDWRTAEPQEDRWNEDYFRAKRAEIRGLRRHGFRLVLDYGLYQVPEWLLNRSGGRFVNQAGQVYLGSEEPNLVWGDRKALDEARRYTAKVVRELGTGSSPYASAVAIGVSSQVSLDHSSARVAQVDAEQVETRDREALDRDIGASDHEPTLDVTVVSNRRAQIGYAPPPSCVVASSTMSLPVMSGSCVVRAIRYRPEGWIPNTIVSPPTEALAAEMAARSVQAVAVQDPPVSAAEVTVHTVAAPALDAADNAPATSAVTITAVANDVRCRRIGLSGTSGRLMTVGSFGTDATFRRRHTTENVRDESEKGARRCLGGTGRLEAHDGGAETCRGRAKPAAETPELLDAVFSIPRRQHDSVRVEQHDSGVAVGGALVQA